MQVKIATAQDFHFLIGHTCMFAWKKLQKYCFSVSASILNNINHQKSWCIVADNICNIAIYEAKGKHPSCEWDSKSCLDTSRILTIKFKQFSDLVLMSATACLHSCMTTNFFFFFFNFKVTCSIERQKTVRLGSTSCLLWDQRTNNLSHKMRKKCLYV